MIGRFMQSNETTKASLPEKSSLNHILPWGKDAIDSADNPSDIDILSYDQYLESNVRKQGHRQGMAQRAPTNKQHCQSAYIAAGIGELVANEAYGGTSVLVDDWENSVEQFTFDLYEKLKKISDVAVDENDDVVHITKTETITGQKTFSLPPKIIPQPVVDNDATNKKYVDDKVKDVADKLLTFNDIYPVGSIYLSLDPVFDPNVAFNQSFVSQKSVWTRIESRFLLGASTTYPLSSSGGSATKSLTVANLPSHSHSGTALSAGSHTHTGDTTINGGHSHNAGSLGGELTGYAAGLVEEAYSGPEDLYGVFYNIPEPRRIGWDFAAYGNNLGFDGSGRIGGSTGTAGSHDHDLNIDSAGSHTHSVSTANVGNNQSFDIMPPYLSVNMWQRIS